MTQFESDSSSSQPQLSLRPGPLNAITDVFGVRVGHFTNLEQATGTTILLFDSDTVAGVDVRGASPGTRETELLRPENLIEHIHALVLSGGSAYGLEAATGVMRFLEKRGVGFDLGEGRVVPIVPAAVLFDLGRGGDWTGRPDANYGLEAAKNAKSGPLEGGNVGAGTGAVAGVLKGGMGTASTVLEGGLTVGALVALNSGGQVFDPRTGRLYAEFLGLDGEFGPLEPLDLTRLPPAKDPRAGQNTTLGVVATNARLSKAQASKVAQMAHDGLARAIRPVHTLFDGDVVFALSTGEVALESPAQLSFLGALAADTLSRAILHAVLAAESIPGHPAYRDMVIRASN